MRGDSSDRAVLEILGSALKACRVERGLSQEELAFRSKLDRSYVGGIERGERNVSFVNLVKIARGLGVPLHELFVDIRGIDGPRKGRRSD